MRSIAASFGIPPLQGKGSWRLLALAFAGLLSGCETLVKDTSRTYRTVVIDAGHGGHDNGATSRWGGREKDAALEVARRLEPKLQAAGFHTVMTRSDDRFIALEQRVSISNRQSNSIFVSIHFNDTRARRIHGMEIYYRSACSRAIAREVLAEIVALPGASSRGVKTANYRVLRRNRYPAVLVECGFLSNRAEATRSATAGYREQLAQAIAAGIVDQRFGPSRKDR